jgi:hypothetical protein
MDLSNTVNISPQAMTRRVGEEMVILDLATGSYLGLDPLGARIWQLITQRNTLAAVLDAVVAEYEVDRETAANDLLALIGEMRAHGLVTVE